jgi:hypothetical protein
LHGNNEGLSLNELAERLGDDHTRSEVKNYLENLTAKCPDILATTPKIRKGDGIKYRLGNVAQ